MSWLSSILVSIFSGAAGLFLAGFIANTCVSWYHVSSREGAAGYFVVFTAVGGGVAGLIVGLVTARIIAGSSGASLPKELAAAVGVVLGIAGVAFLLCRFFADVPPKIDGRELNLEVEFRFPKTNSGTSPIAEGEWKFWLGSSVNHTQRASETGTIKTNAVRFDEGRWIIPAEVFLFTERGNRTIALQKGDQDTAGFLVPLPARPGRSFEQWSDWMPRQLADGQPWPADKMSYRFRVQKEVPPPPAPGYDQLMAEEAAKEEAEFAAIPADAPIERWMAYLHKTPQQDRALNNIMNRPTFAKEVGGLALGQDANIASAALRLIDKHPKPSADFIAPVEAAGRDLAERMRKVNAATVEEDPSFLGAADISVRFNGWMAAVRSLREKCGGDFTPELKTILELSRVRTDSYVMRTDVCRVASYYLHQWAGIAPLPTDPEPR